MIYLALYFCFWKLYLSITEPFNKIKNDKFAHIFDVNVVAWKTFKPFIYSYILFNALTNGLLFHNINDTFLNFVIVDFLLNIYTLFKYNKISFLHFINQLTFLIFQNVYSTIPGIMIFRILQYIGYSIFDLFDFLVISQNTIQKFVRNIIKKYMLILFALNEILMISITMNYGLIGFFISAVHLFLLINIEKLLKKLKFK